MKQKVKKLFSFVYTSWVDIFYFFDKGIKAYWWKDQKNFGDILNAYYIEKITGKKPVWVDMRYYRHKHLASIGSIVHMSNKGSVIMGAGIINLTVPRINSIEYRKVCFLRGEMTQKTMNLDNENIKLCDPGLFLPLLFNPDVEKETEIGIIPHIWEMDYFSKIEFDDNIKIISVVDDVESFVKNILSCKYILSASLHGLIVSDAYKIPNHWIIGGKKPEKWQFKFYDYYSSCGLYKDDIVPTIVDNETDFNALREKCSVNNFPHDIKSYFEEYKELLKNFGDL